MSSEALSSEVVPSRAALSEAPLAEAAPPGTPLPAAETCRNCGAPLVGRFCADCGQDSAHRLRSVRQLVASFVDHFFALDARFVRTTWQLLRRPGLLTRDYLAGREVRYVPPLRLYLVCSFFLFFTLSVLNADPAQFTLLPPEEPAAEQAEGSAAAAEGAAAEDAAADDEADVADLGVVTMGDTDNNGIDLHLGDSALGQRFSQVIKEKTRQAFADPARMQQALLDRTPLMMFLLLPFFALMMKLLYVRRGWLYVSHFIFSLHVHAFVFLLVLVVSVVDAVVPLRETGLWINIGALVYLFLAMRRVYQQPRWKTFVKLWILFWAYLLTFGVAFIAMTLVTLWFL